MAKSHICLPVGQYCPHSAWTCCTLPEEQQDNSRMSFGCILCLKNSSAQLGLASARIFPVEMSICSNHFLTQVSIAGFPKEAWTTLWKYKTPPQTMEQWTTYEMYQIFNWNSRKPSLTSSAVLFKVLSTRFANIRPHCPPVAGKTERPRSENAWITAGGQ